jgi:glycolate oxidase FAD binding subunit
MLTTVDQLMHRLQSSLGPGAVTIAAEALASHPIDGIIPQLVATPESNEQIGASLRLCSEARATVAPWGGGTAMAIGNPPRQVDVVMKLDRLNRVIEHDAANLTVSAQGGMTLNTLQSALRSEKQFVPIDAPFPDRSTLGGIVAGNLNGPRRSSCGSVRDLVIGMKVILAGGEVIKAGGKVVKNVAGYDMCKLFVGSLGTLGIIAEATIRVAPIAESAATFVARGTFEQVHRLTDELAGSQLLPAAAFLARESTADDWRLAVGCEGFGETVDRHIRDLTAIATRAALQAQVFRAEAHGNLWAKLRDFPLERDCVVYRITLPRAAIFEFIEQIKDWNLREILADTSMGSVWLAFPAHQASIARFSEIEKLARQRRGHAVLFSAPAGLKTGVNVWGPSPPTLSLMREIKRQFDPHEILNPGRFLAGI